MDRHILQHGEVTSVTHDARLDLYYANTVQIRPDGTITLDSCEIDRELAQIIQSNLRLSPEEYFYFGE